MKDKEKQIEEMAMDIDFCKVLLSKAQRFEIARELYEQGYRKLPEDSVVLSREEYDKLKYAWITDSDAYKKGSKETAEKIITFMKGFFDSWEDTDKVSKVVMIGYIKEVAKQFGVEIKE